MKNIIIVTALFILITSPIRSQSTIGIEGGINLANVNTSMNQEEDSRMKPGLHFGANLEWEFSDKASIITGIYYSQKGSISKNEAVKITQELSYVDIPVTINYKSKGKKLTPTFGAGFYIGLLLNSLHKEEFTTDEYYESDTMEDYKSSDFGFLLDAGLNYRISKLLQLNVKGSYYFGIMNVLNDDLNWFGEVKNTGPRFATGLKINLN